MRQFVAKYPVLVFTLLTLAYQFAVVGVVWARLGPGQHMHDDAFAHMVFRFRVFGPLVFAMLLTFYLEGGKGLRTLFEGFIHWKVPAKWYLLAFSWKFLFTYVGIGFLVLVGQAQWPGWVVDNFFGGDLSNLKAWLSNLGFIVGIAFVEETAWMKFSVTRMQERYSALTSCLLVGIGWGLWYLAHAVDRRGCSRWISLAHVPVEHGMPDGAVGLDLQHDAQRHHPVDHADREQLRLLHRPGLRAGLDGVVDPTNVNAFVAVNCLSRLAAGAWSTAGAN
jgi:hypothetical protein